MIQTSRSTIQLDLPLLEKLGIVQRICLAIVTVVAAATLAGWLVPPIGNELPHGWWRMQVSTTLAALGCAISLTLSQARRSRRMLLASHIFAGCVTVMSTTILLGYALQLHYRMDELLVAKAWLPHTATMSLQASCAFALLSIITFFIRIRRQPASRIVDFLLFGLCLLILVIGSSHLFDIRSNPRNYTSPQAFICLMLLAYVAVLRRAEHGAFSILLGIGIGSKIVRIACPFALLLPFLLEMSKVSLVTLGLLSPSYATALTTSLAAMLAFGLILMLAWRIDTLEKAVRDLSFRDDLTRLYNRRGFYVAAEQALHQAQRSKVPFSVLYIDVDDLKQINDSFGHESGSELLAETGRLLRQCFRRSDVIGRIGGDEFVVAGEASEITIHLATERLKKIVAEWNAHSGQPYALHFSYGHVTAGENIQESLSDLLAAADKAMYNSKRSKKLKRDSDASHRIAI